MAKNFKKAAMLCLSLMACACFATATGCFAESSSTDSSIASSDSSIVSGESSTPDSSDTGSSDTGSSDTGSSDSSDTGSSDTGSSDTGSSDTGSSDTGSSDTGSSDTGSSDTGSSDSSDSSDTGSSDSSDTGSSDSSDSSDTGSSDSAPAAGSTLSIADAISFGAGLETSTYSDGKYYITGTITNITTSYDYGNVTISDGTNSILIYGLLSADGSTQYGQMTTKPCVGDTVTAYGIIGNHNGTAQMKNGWMTNFVDSYVDPAANSTLTLAQATELGSKYSAWVYTSGKYYVSGTISEVDASGTMTITDGTNSFYIYKTYSADGATGYADMTEKPVVGDTVTVYGLIGNHQGNPQMKNGWITAFTPAVQDNGWADIVANTDLTNVTITESFMGMEAVTYLTATAVAQVYPDGTYQSEDANVIASIRTSYGQFFTIGAENVELQADGTYKTVEDYVVTESMTGGSIKYSNFVFTIEDGKFASVSMHVAQYVGETLMQEFDGTATYTNYGTTVIPEIEEEATPFESYNYPEAGTTNYTFTLENAGVVELFCYTDKISIVDEDGNTILFSYDESREGYYANVNLAAGTYVWAVTFSGTEEDGNMLQFSAVDGSLNNPFEIGGYGAESTYTGSSTAGKWYYLYDNYNNTLTYTVSTTADNCSVAILTQVWDEDSESYIYVPVGTTAEIDAYTNFFVQVTVTGEGEAEWTLVYEVPQEGTEGNPKTVYEATIVEDITLATGDAYYLNLQGALQFVVPQGVSAMDSNRVTYAAGDTIAYAEYDGRWNYQLSVLLTALEDVTFDLEITAIEGSGEGGDEGGDGEETETPVLVLGENSFLITLNGYGWPNMIEATFTATEAGTYTINAADGETNADVYLVTVSGSEWLELPYAFTLAAGESVSFAISCANFEEDTIDLVIAVSEGGNDNEGGDDENEALPFENYNFPEVGTTNYTFTIQNSAVVEVYAYTDKITIADADGNAIALTYDESREVYATTLNLAAGTYVWAVTFSGTEEDGNMLYFSAIDGSLNNPFVIGGENAEPTFTASVAAGEWYYKYDNYNNTVTYTVSSTNSNCSVEILAEVWDDEIGSYTYVSVGTTAEIGAYTNFYVKVTVTGEGEAEWTLAFEAPAEGTEGNPKVVSEPTTIDVALAAEESYYIILQGALQFVVPQGMAARVGMMPVAAGETVAFADFHPMMNRQLYVMLMALEDVSATIDVVAYAANDEEVGFNDANFTLIDEFGETTATAPANGASYLLSLDTMYLNSAIADGDTVAITPDANTKLLAYAFQRATYSYALVAELNAGEEFTFVVGAEDGDPFTTSCAFVAVRADGEEGEVSFSIAVAEAEEEVPGNTMETAITIGGENAEMTITNSTEAGVWYYGYDNYVAMNVTFTASTSAENCTVELLVQSWNEDYTELTWAPAGASAEIAAWTNFFVKVTVTGESEAEWTLSYELPPEGTETNPKAVAAATTLEDITIKAGEFYYLVLQAPLQFVVPEGISARAGRMPVVSGATLAFDSYHPMFSSELYVTLANTGAEDITFDLAIKKYLSPAEIVNIAYALESYKYTTETYTLTGTVIAVDTAYSSQYKNVTVTFVVEGCEDKPIMAYRMSGTGADVIGVGDQITVTGGFKNHYGTIEFTAVTDNDVTIHGSPTLDAYDTEAFVSDAAKVATEQYALALATTKFDNVVEGLQLPMAGATYNNVVIEWTEDSTGAIIEGGIYNVPQVSETTTIALTATLTLGEVSFNKTLQITVNYVAANAIVKSYTFSEYTAGTQYAENEKHVLDEYITVTTTQAHFTTQLRLYSSSTHDGFAIISSTKVIDSITLNAGNKADTLNVYGSTDGTTWTLIKGVTTTSDYADHTVNITNSTYTYLKLDVAGSQQVRVASMTITMQG